MGQRVLKRKLKLVANGTMSEEEDVLSWVPQGTVLALILFAIMIPDTDKKRKDSIVRYIVDDIRVSKVIRSDKEKMQKVLYIFYK